MTMAGKSAPLTGNVQKGKAAPSVRHEKARWREANGPFLGGLASRLGADDKGHEDKLGPQCDSKARGPYDH